MENQEYTGGGTWERNHLDVSRVGAMGDAIKAELSKVIIGQQIWTFIGLMHFD